MSSSPSTTLKSALPSSPSSALPSSPPSALPSSPPSAFPSSPPSSLDDDSEDELVNIQPSEVTFLEILQIKEDRKNGNNFVATFKVKFRNKLCVMKVFKDIEVYDPFNAEASAYRLLKEKGFCKRGLVPKFYGTIERIDTDLWPNLSMFSGHERPPNAILIEYIPNAKRIDLSNFSQDNIDRLSATLFEFHEAGLIHGDTYPRNMMVAEGTPDRVFWLDFDNSEMVTDKYSARMLKLEKLNMTGFAQALSDDAKAGKLEEAYYFYC